MQVGNFLRKSRISRFGMRLLIAALVLVGIVGCAPVPAQPLPTDAPSPVPPTATLAAEPTVSTVPAGWQTDTGSQQCGFSISHPAEMQGVSQDSYSWLITTSVSDQDQAARNFVYVTAVPSDFQSGTELAYNYDPAGADLLLNLQVREAKSVHPSPDMAQWFTFTRLPDVTIGDQTAQAYENAKPWEFPAGTKELRYYLKANDCIYQVGGYFDTTGSTKPGTMSEALFNQIVATFQVKP
jgi:hypothetical protein